jgi:nucleotide-binding universal stress UspA family protein
LEGAAVNDSTVSTTTRIVVGIDASEHALRALRWARDEARLRGATLEVVHAYPPPEVMLMPALVTLPSDEELIGAATRSSTTPSPRWGSSRASR